MSNRPHFTDKDIKAIEKKVSEKFDLALRRLLILTIPVCLAMPYFPGRHGAMIDRMEYDSAVIRSLIIWAVLIAICAIWFPIKTKKQVSEKRKFLRKKNRKSIVVKKGSTIFTKYNGILHTDQNDELKKVIISQIQSSEIQIGDTIEIEYEEQTKAILSIKNCNEIIPRK